MSTGTLSKPELRDLVSYLQDSTGAAISEDILNVVSSVLENPTLKDILGKSQESLTTGVNKIIFAKKELSTEMYNAIGEGNIIALGMSFDKLSAIGIGDPEGYDPMDVGLSLEQVNAIGGKNLANPEVNNIKIKFIGSNLSVEQIKMIGGENLAHPEMTCDKINHIGFNMSIEQIREIGGDVLATISLAELVLGEEKYSALGDVWKNNESKILPGKINAINKFLSVEQITAIGGYILCLENMSPDKIRVIGETLSVQQIEQVGGEKLAEMSFAELLLPQDKFEAFGREGATWEGLKPHVVIAINDNLSANQILEIGGERLSSMSIKEIKAYNDVV